MGSLPFQRLVVNGCPPVCTPLGVRFVFAFYIHLFQRLGFGGWEMIMCLEYRTPKGVQFIVVVLCPAVETAGYPNPRPNGLDLYSTAYPK